MSADASASSLVPPQAVPAETVGGQETIVEVEEVEAVVVGPLAGDPMAIGLPLFIVGSVALGLAEVGVVPAAAVGAALPIILCATAIGMFAAMIWSASLGQSAVASVFGIFGGFWFSYAILVLGLTHNWFGIAATSIQATQELFLVSWLVVIVMLTLATLRLPSVYTLLFFLVDLALLLIFLSVNEASSGLAKAGGYVILLFAAVGVYLYAHMASMATGGKPLVLGRPVLK